MFFAIRAGPCPALPPGLNGFDSLDRFPEQGPDIDLAPPGTDAVRSHDPSTGADEQFIGVIREQSVDGDAAGGDQPCAASSRTASIIVCPLEMMSSTRTAARPCHASRFLSVILKSRSPWRTFSRTQ